MKNVLDLDRLSLEEKFRAMEELWAALSVPPEQYPSPDWHAHVLLERQKALEAGEDEFIPWEVAKKQLRNES